MKYKYIIASFLRGLCRTDDRRKMLSIVSQQSNKIHHDLSDAFKIDIQEDFDMEQESNYDPDSDLFSLIRTAYSRHREDIINSSFFAINIMEVYFVISHSEIANSKKVDDRISYKVALVTGAAQGFGRGIAEYLISAGAFVFITDINGEKAQVCTQELCAKYGSNVASAIEMDCADETSVKNSVAHVVERTGGLDILVSNAGVTISGGVETMTKQFFMKTAEINYLGYFLLVKYFAPVFKSQFCADNDYYSDIIQINSKSGLLGSNKNSAYAGSKFGGIGLTQSFALELIECNIKVNAICPGNFYDGPMWSDPENGLFQQYLDTGKVPGAKTIADVRKAYESKSPIKRGCTVDDVVKGIAYLIEQKYETGQALPIAGGHSMLH